MYVGRLHDQDPPSRVRFYERALATARALPDVEWAGLNDYLPLKSEDDYEGFEVAGRPAEPGGLPREEWRRVGGDYFRAVGMRLVRGRLFLPADDATAPSVALINESLAGKYWPGQDPLGRRIRITHDGYGWSEIVGVLADAREAGLDQPAKPMLFVPYARGPRPHMALFVKTARDPLAVLPVLRRELARSDPTQPVSEEGTLRGLVRESLAVRRLALRTLASLAGMALALTMAGVFGALTHLVAQRTREIGLRMALGAKRADVLRLVLGKSLRLAGAGAALGLAAAFALVPLERSLLYGITPTDPATLVGVVLIVLSTAVLACSVPARRAVSLSPLEALRHE
jgi:putative ABC transport system permease protein